MLPVNEVFATIQGEGCFTGTPAWFIRLQGCPVGCGWCDTKHTWSLDPGSEGSAEEILAKDERPGAAYARMTTGQIVDCLQAHHSIRHAVITGGEPCLYDLRELTAALAGQGMGVQIETSCTANALVSDAPWITASPKLDMPGGLPVLPGMLGRANEIKFPVGKPTDIAKLVERVLPHVGPSTPIYLQPLSLSPKATALCTDAAKRYGWRVSIQVHKYIGVR